MVKDHSDSERGNPLLLLYGLLYLISSKESFICTNPQIEVAQWVQQQFQETVGSHLFYSQDLTLCDFLSFSSLKHIKDNNDLLLFLFNGTFNTCIKMVILVLLGLVIWSGM